MADVKTRPPRRSAASKAGASIFKASLKKDKLLKAASDRFEAAYMLVTEANAYLDQALTSVKDKIKTRNLLAKGVGLLTRFLDEVRVLRDLGDAEICRHMPLEWSIQTVTVHIAKATALVKKLSSDT